MALAMTMSDKPMAVNMSFQREYAEPYEWMKQQFIDLAFTFLTSVIFYEDYDDMTPDQRLLMQEGMTAFGGIAPTYRIALLDKPTIIWDFHSLMLRFLYKGIIIKHNKTEPTYTKTSLFLCEKRRFFMARTEKGVVTTI